MGIGKQTIEVDASKAFAWASDRTRILDKVRSKLRDAEFWVGEVAEIATEVSEHVIGDEEDEDERDADEDLGELAEELKAVQEVCDDIGATTGRITLPPEGTPPAGTDGEIDRQLATISESMALVRRLDEVALQLDKRLTAMTDYAHMEYGKEDKYEFQGIGGGYIVLDGRTLVIAPHEITEVLETCWLALQLARRMRDEGREVSANPGGEPSSGARVAATS